ncbi:MAG: hypothetical protein EXR13_01380 [Candidatus Fonsibacter sp.]|nr:hypothetical protein [Candidatus Fonsibacter sp.]
MFKNLLGYWYLKKKISSGFLGEGLVSLKSKKLNNFYYEEKSLIYKKDNENTISGYQKFDIIQSKNFIKFYFLLGEKKNKIYQKFNNNLKEDLVSWYFCKKDTYKTYLRVINNNLFKIDHLITGPNKRILIQNTYYRSSINN